MCLISFSFSLVSAGVIIDAPRSSTILIAFSTSCAFVAQTVIMGGNPRVGLEDNLYLSKGKLATNAQLVEKAIRIVNDLGVSIMTPAETREKLKLKNYK